MKNNSIFIRSIILIVLLCVYPISVQFNHHSVVIPSEINVYDTDLNSTTSRLYWIKNNDIIFPNSIHLQNLRGQILHGNLNKHIENVIDITNIKYTIEHPKTNQAIDSDHINLNDLSDTQDQLHIQRMWDAGITGEDTVVAVIDTGIDFNHPALKDKMFLQNSFVTTSNGYDNNENSNDGYGHGTSVASIIAGKDIDNQYNGNAFNAMLVNAKVGSSNGIITAAGLISAFDWVIGIDEIDVINLSLSGPEDGPGQDILEYLLNLTVKTGKTVISSAGNSGRGNQFIHDPMTIGTPGTDVEAITVGGTTPSGSLWQGSSEGPTTNWQAKPDLVAPALNIQSAKQDDNDNYSSCSITSCYVSQTGTSFSAPLVAGIAALIIQLAKVENLEPNPGLIKSILTTSATDLGFEWYMQGNGLVNASKAYDFLIAKTNFSTVYPKKLPYFSLLQVPQTINQTFPLTVISDSKNHWLINKINGNISDILSMDSLDGELGYSQLIWITIHPNLTTPIGLYNGNIQLTSPSGVLHKIEVTSNVTQKPEVKILLDLVHTPWDSILSSNNKRLERINGEDITGMKELLNDQNIWVEEFVEGYLTKETLEKYDVLWMVSSFTKVSPLPFDYELPRSTLLTSEELFAIYNFRLGGGNIILDFGGTYQYDNTIDYTIPDQNSLESMLSIFGSKPGYITNLPTLNPSSMSNHSSYYQEGLISQTGTIPISNGIGFYGDDDYLISGFLGVLGSKSLIINNRNWRDVNSFNDPQKTASAQNLINWMFDSSFIQSLNYSYSDQSTTFMGNFEGNSLAIKAYNGISKDIPIEINNFSLDQEGNFQFSITKTSGNITLMFIGEDQWFDYVIELDNMFPQIGIKDAIQYEDGIIEFRFSFSDNKPIPAYNFRATINSNLEYDGLYEHNDIYSLKINSSDNIGSYQLEIEIIDANGNYIKQSQIIDTFVSPEDNSPNNIIFATTLTFVILSGLAYLWYSRKIKNTKKGI